MSSLASDKISPEVRQSTIGLEESSVEASSRSSISSDSTTMQGTADIATTTAPETLNTSYKGSTSNMAHNNRSKIRHRSQMLKEGGPSHEYHASQVPEDTNTFNDEILSTSELSELKDLQNLQGSISHPISGAAATSPDAGSFRDVLPPVVIEEFPAHLKHRSASKIILVLHDYGGDEFTLRDFAEEHLKEPDALYILIRGIRPVDEKSSGYHWADSDCSTSRSFLEATKMIGRAIFEILVRRNNISSRNIVLFGHGQGGMAALSVATTWTGIEFGGVITVGGPLPKHFGQPAKPSVATPVLVLGGKLGDINAIAEKRIRDFAMHVDVHLTPDVQDMLPQRTDTDSIFMLKEFLAHRLVRKEWEEPSVLTLDGGGIRGYGTLLILKDLMNRIGVLEKKMDPNTVSSFYPRPYRPTSHGRPQAPSMMPPSLERRATTFIEPTAADGLQNSELFYPCHYFTYIGGTSTGGLISIMLSRLRMSVEDSLKEYKRLGNEVFGYPRPIPNKGIAWSKFNWRHLHRAIDDVVQRHHSPTGEKWHTWPSENGYCRTVVVAYASTETTETPYLFRTYEAFEHPEIERRHTVNKILNPGKAQNLDIPSVGRATSAAPGYFAPAEIRVSQTQIIKFKDGGFGRNNPSDVIRRDVRELHGGSNKNLGPFVSIGTGADKEIEKFPKDGAFRHLREFWRNLKSSTDMVTLTAGAHENMLDAASDGMVVNFPYFRFDGGERLGKLKMDAWVGHRLVGITGRDPTPGCKTIEEMDAAVAMYLQDPEVSKDLDAAADLLVRRRRYRIRDESRWDRYACASWYQCPYACKETKRYDTLCAFREHVLKDHKYQVPLEVLESELAKVRHCWVYPTKEVDETTVKSDEQNAKNIQNGFNGAANGHTNGHVNGASRRIQVESAPRIIVRHASL